MAYAKFDYGKLDYGKLDYEKLDYGKLDYEKLDYGKMNYSKMDYGKLFDEMDKVQDSFGWVDAAPFLTFLCVLYWIALTVWKAIIAMRWLMSYS